MTTPAGDGRARLDTPGALQRLMRSDYPLSDEQFAAVTAPLEPAVVIAGAGSGKTTLMAARVVWLVATGQVRPDEVLGLTFTTKAAAELATRVRDALCAAGLLPLHDPRLRDVDEVLEPTVATYNSYAASLLSDHGLRIGHEPDSRVITDAARHQLAARVVARHTREVRCLSDHPRTVINYLLGLDAAMNEHLVEPEAVIEFQRRQRELIAKAREEATLKGHRDKLANTVLTLDKREELLHMTREYRTLKKSLGLMEFSDQISLGAKLARSAPEVGAIERSRFTVVLLDEYQDTSVAQALMLSSLFSGPDTTSGRGHAVMAVGDPNQAIYGWRGASVSNILRFGESFPNQDGSTEVTTFSLATNRRSDERILDLANTLAAPLYDKVASVQPLKAKRGALPGEIHAQVFTTYAEELAWLPDQVKDAQETYGEWRSIGVLTRDNAHAADVFESLTKAGVPVEIVGLKGLLQLPEVAEVVATLTLLQDLTANAAMLTLLTGPRWAVGARDLALLGHRAGRLAGGRGRKQEAGSLRDALAEAVTGADPVEVSSLSDALDDPGPADYSPEARERFALLSAELKRLRRHTGEPLLDLVRQIIDSSGIDVELASAVTPTARARRDNLDAFVRAVSDFKAIDGDVSLPALLSYLDAEEDESGMDVATPSAADTVKLLTVHRAKGLEWDAVFLVGMSRGKFPNTRGRGSWLTICGQLPSPLRGDARDLPQLTGHSKEQWEHHGKDRKEHEATEELRLGYVAFTRARHRLVISSYVWQAGKAQHCGPSPYHQSTRDFLQALADKGELDGPLPDWPDPVQRGTPNPCGDPEPVPWPPEGHTPEVRRREQLAAEVAAAIKQLETQGPDADGTVPDRALTVDERALVAQWDSELERLVAEASRRRADTVEVPMPSSLSVTSLLQLRTDPERLAVRLARPMPVPPAASARLGTRFHAWVEATLGRSRQEPLLDSDYVDGRADLGIDDESELTALIGAFQSGPFAQRRARAVEQPFALVLGGQVVRGRIDAVFDEPDGTVLVVDWKTNRAQDADPTQLAVYRVAYAELAGVPVDSVRAAFYYVRDGVLITHEDLIDREDLARLLLEVPQGA